MNKTVWRFKKILSNPLTVGLLLGALNFLAVVLIQPKNYVMGIATLAIFGGVVFVVEFAWVSSFMDIEVETTHDSLELRRVFDYIIVGAIVLCMMFGGHHELLSGPTARFRLVTPLMSMAVWIGYLVTWLHIRDKRSWQAIVNSRHCRLRC